MSIFNAPHPVYRKCKPKSRVAQPWVEPIHIKRGSRKYCADNDHMEYDRERALDPATDRRSIVNTREEAYGARLSKGFRDMGGDE